MDDRNLIAVAEQAAATAKVNHGPLEGCTILFEDGRVFLGCKLEFEDSDLNQDSVSNALAAGRVEGAYRPYRIGIYAPVAGGLPQIAPAALRRLKEVASSSLVVIKSSGSGERVEFPLQELLANAKLG